MSADAKQDTMTDRQRKQAVLQYQPYDRLPIVHFGFWGETLQKWEAEGHLTHEEATTYGDGNATDAILCKKMGFDSNWSRCRGGHLGLRPGFESKVIKEFPDGTKHLLNGYGVVVVQKPEAGSIPAEIEHTLVDRESWEEHYKWRYEWHDDRVQLDEEAVAQINDPNRDTMLGVFCGSMYGRVRDILGVEGACYMLADDEDLLTEIIDTNAELCYRVVKTVLETGARFDFAHFWEDICFKNGPLITPSVFEEKCGHHYKRITDLCRAHGIEIVSLDCDGMIDALIPTWLENGVNTMFPIEVGTWNASIAPWREKYGKELRGVGGMNKCVFARDKAAVDAEVERLRPLVDLGGFIPCPDHRIPPDAKWDLVLYYTERMRAVFG